MRQFINLFEGNIVPEWFWFNPTTQQVLEVSDEDSHDTTATAEIEGIAGSIDEPIWMAIQKGWVRVRYGELARPLRAKYGKNEHTASIQGKAREVWKTARWIYDNGNLEDIYIDTPETKDDIHDRLDYVTDRMSGDRLQYYLSKGRVPSAMVMEALDTSSSITWSDNSSGGIFQFNADMTVAGSFIMVKFSCVRGEGGYSIQFNRDGALALTKQGGAFKILGAVEKAICEFVDVRRPKWISLSADLDEPSRVKLYKRLLPMVMQKFPEYSMREKSTRSFVTFFLDKNGGPEPKAYEHYGEQPTEYAMPERNSYSGIGIDDISDDDLLAMLNESAEQDIQYIHWSSEDMHMYLLNHHGATKRITYLMPEEVRREFYIVALLNDTVLVGAAGLQISPYDEKELWIKFISVDPDYREQGIGRTLSVMTVDYAHQHDLKFGNSSYTDLGAERLKPIMDKLRAK